jgi:hypothetical protein
VRGGAGFEDCSGSTSLFFQVLFPPTKAAAASAPNQQQISLRREPIPHHRARRPCAYAGYP